MIEPTWQYKNTGMERLVFRLSGNLNNYLHLTTVDAEGKHILDPKWDAFINHKQRIRLYVPSSPKTIKDLEIWVDKQVGAAIAAIVVSYDGKYDFFIQNMPKWLERLEGTMTISNVCPSVPMRIQKIKIP